MSTVEIVDWGRLPASPVVSVCMITYNHEKFIAKAIESVLMQETEFPVELVIGEDCSTDGTRAIVIEYAEQYPDRIRLLLPERNLGMTANFVATLQACRGKYVALLEGDDYWTDPHKLQKQVEFLEGHPECSMCFHDAMVAYEDNSHLPRNYCSENQKKISTLEDLMLGNFIPTCSVLFRNVMTEKFPDWFYSVSMADWPLHILNAQHGKIGYLNETMATYRIHKGGMVSGLIFGSHLSVIQMYGKVNTYLDFRYESLIRMGALKRWDAWVEKVIEVSTRQQKPAEIIVGKFIEALNQWPNELPLTCKQRSQMLSRACINLGFTCHRLRDSTGVRYCLAMALRHDISWLRNRGIWSIGLDAFLGRQLAGWLREKAKRVVIVFRSAFTII